MTDKSHLLRFGYAPGNYWFVCKDCGDKQAVGDKRATRCYACAESLYAQITSVEDVADKHRAMTTLPEEAVKAAMTAQENAFIDGYDPDIQMKAAITAALPFLPVQGAVKKLDWQEPSKATNGCWVAKCEIGTYSVVNEGGWYAALDEGAWGTRGFEWISSDLSKDTRETAFAAAQADYEARILSALEPSASRAAVREEAKISAQNMPGTIDLDQLAAAQKSNRTGKLDERAQALEEAAQALEAWGDIYGDNAAKCVRALSSQPVADASFQERVKPWMLACFGEKISNDKLERCDRFIEEALELVQAIGYSTERAHALVDYVFNRDIGEPHQEVGGVMVTLAALCLASGLDMNKAGEDELARIWTKVEKIRAKQAAKPTGSALPIALPASPEVSG